MKRMISKKLQIDENNDSLLEEPLIKKFIGVSHRVEVAPLTRTVKNTLHLKFMRPEMNASKSPERKKIISVSPSATRISFFTKYNQSRLMDHPHQHGHGHNTSNFQSGEGKQQKLKSSRSSGIDSSKLVFRSFGSTPPKVSFIRRRLSMGTLKPKSQVERVMAYRRKNLMENPFRESLRESDYI